jgi:molybdopterin-guanine dinucleotide biosynthesis protein A
VGDSQAGPETLGVVLAGGLARRMGGGDKGFRLVGGTPILARVIDRLRPQCAGLVINANGDPVRFSAFGLPVAADSVADFAGPLAGVLAGLDWAAANRPEIAWILTAAADTPFLPADLVERLHAARVTAGAELACAETGGQRHNVDALWPVSLREPLRAALVEEGLRRVDRFTARYRLATAEWPTEPIDPFFNANTPEDLALAERLAAYG